MGEYDLSELGDCVTHPYGKRCRCDELRAGVTHHVYAHHGLGFGVQHEFAQTCLTFVLCHEPSGERHRQRACFAAFKGSLADADGSYFGVGIYDRWDSVISDTLYRYLLEHSTDSNLGLARCDMRKHDLACHIAGSIDVLEVCTAEVVHDNRAAVELKLGEGFQALQVRAATYADEDLVGFERFVVVQNDFVALERRDFRRGEDLYTAFTNNSSKAGVYIGSFILKKVGDTFINLERWGKGQVYVNGHALGRFWSIGPQQSLYCPGCWLKKGKNEIIVFDVVGPKETTIRGQAQPELDKLQMEKSNKHNNPGNCPDLNSDTPALLGTASSGNGWQTFRFATPQKGRLICIQINGNQDGKLQTAIAELYALDAQGKRLSREPWVAHYADSENLNGNHTLDKVFDLQESTYWQTERNAEFPHLMVIDLGSEQTVTAVEYLPRAEEGAPGSIKDFKIFLK